MKQPGRNLLEESCGQVLCRSLWARRLSGEDHLPETRIIHALLFRPAGAVRLRRLGLKPCVRGYFKCGDVNLRDRVVAFRVLQWTGRAWRELLRETKVNYGRRRGPLWFDLAGVETTGLRIEARESATDGGWTCWNLTTHAFILQGEILFAPDPDRVEPDRWLQVAMAKGACPKGVSMRVLAGEVRYRSRFLEVGFKLGRTGWSFLAVDERGMGHTHVNLLSTQSVFGSRTEAPERDYWTQGLRLFPVGQSCAVGANEHAVEGRVCVRGNRVEYDVTIPAARQRYVLRWTIHEARLELEVERIGAAEVRAWQSSAWHICLDSRITQCCSLGHITREGETGLMFLPVLFHAPRMGTLRVTAGAGDPLWRADCCRPFTTAEIKVGETATRDGDYRLRAGRHRARLEFAIAPVGIPCRPGTPPAVQNGLDRCALTALTYRADTATLTNNGASMDAIICLDCWSATITRLAAHFPAGERALALELLRNTIERWLSGGPTYAGGWVNDAHWRRRHLVEEYTMTAATPLLGLADFLGATRDRAWLRRHAAAIRAELDRTRALDVDDDGLIESNSRLGVSGQHRWSTNWYDVISFGWKDAFVNALLYPALRGLALILPALGQPDLAAGLTDWADKLHANYTGTFFNRQTGWLAGWQCREGKLHDYGFLFVNGAAVNAGLLEPEVAGKTMRGLWQALERAGVPDFRLGLPGNLQPIPWKDLGARMPDGIYQNRGLTHSQARHFIGALYKTGLSAEGDRLLHAMMASLADDTAFGGLESGTDWRRWDGERVGYEGMLSDQFGVLAIALQRYGRPRAVKGQRNAGGRRVQS